MKVRLSEYGYDLLLDSPCYKEYYYGRQIFDVEDQGLECFIDRQTGNTFMKEELIFLDEIPS